MLKKMFSRRMMAFIVTLGLFLGIFNGHIVKAESAFDYSSIFDFTDKNDYYEAKLKDDFWSTLQAAGLTEIVFPETYEGSDGVKPVKAALYFWTTTTDEAYEPKSGEDKVTAITFNQSTDRAGMSSLGYFTGLKKVTYLYSGASMLLQGKIVADQIGRRSGTTDIEFYFHAMGFSTVNVDAFKFLTGNPDFKIYVKDDTLAQKIVTDTASGSNSVSLSQIEVMQSEKQESSFDIECDNITFGDKNGFQPKAINKVGDGEVTFKIYNNEQCDEAGVLSSMKDLPIGVYYILGIMPETDTYQASRAVLRVEVQAIPEINKTELNQAIQDACTFFGVENVRDLITSGSPNKENYDATAWNAAESALSRADDISKDETGRYTQEQANKAVEDLTAAMDTLKKSPLDTSAEWAVLQEAIKSAEAFAAKHDKGEVKYTDATLKALKDAIAAAQELEKETATLTQVKKQTEQVNTAIKGLQRVADASLEPFVFVQRGGKEAKVATIKADAKMAGAKKVLLTIKCANDVSFNDNASIEVNATVGGKQNYQKIMGTNNYTTGASYVVEIPLSDVVKEGDTIEVSAFTYAWDNAKDYVYGVTKVELAKEDDTVLYAYTDKTAADENLAKKIEEADKMDLSGYTDASAAKVKEALKAAKELNADASAEDVKQALNALEAAIKSLEKKASTPTPSPSPAPTSDPDTRTQVLGVEKGQTFTAGNFTYKVTTAATITGTKKTAGAVSVKPLTKAGRKKTSINVKNTVTNAGASYKVTAIEKGAFQKATKLKKVTLGINIKTIPANAFNGCKKLTTVSAKGARKIDKGAFKGCKALKKLTFGKKKLSSVKKGAFKGCKKTIKVSGGKKKICKANIKKLKKSGYKKFK